MKTTPSSILIDTFDIYGKTFSLQVLGQEKHKTKFGSLVGFLSIAMIIAISVYFVVDLAKRKNMTVINNLDLNQLPTANHTDLPFGIAVTDLLGMPLDWQGVYTLDVKILNATPGTGQKTYSSVSLERCDIDKHFGQLRSMFVQYPVSMAWCIPPSTFNMSFYGVNGDAVNGWTSLQIFVNKCNPAFEKCKNESHIESQLSTFEIMTFFMSNSIDNYNSVQPNTQIVSTQIFFFTSTLFKTYMPTWNAYTYMSDNGFVFEDVKTFDFWTLGPTTSDISLTAEGLNTVGPTVGYINYSLGPGVTNITRTYIKAQTVLANIGGIIKAILVIGNFFSSILVRKIRFVDIANYVFNFNQDDLVADSKVKKVLKKKVKLHPIVKREVNEADKVIPVDPLTEQAINFSKKKIKTIARRNSISK